MKKILSLVLALVMVLSLCMGAASAENKTIKGWGAWTFNDQSGITSYSEQFLWQEIAARLGITVEWETVSGNERNTLFALMMADAGNLPDMVTDMGPLYYEEFGRMGALIALNEYITPEKMPNLYALLEQYPDAKASITSADGNIYFLPRIMEAPTRYWNGLFIREDMLKEVGLEVPTNIDEFYQAMVAIKNGIDTVDYPISMNRDSLKTLMYPWNIGVRGTGLSSSDDAYIKDGAIHYSPKEDAYRDALAYLAKLFAEGLINPDWASLGGNDIRTDIVTKTAAVCQGSFSGMMSTYNSALVADGQGEALTYILPMESAEGVYAWPGHHTAIDVSYGMAITAGCEDIDSVLAIMDYTYSEEGRTLVYWGVEGKTYTVKEDGTKEFTEEVLTSELGTLNYLNSFSANTSCYPSYQTVDFYHKTLSAKAAEGNIKQTALGEANDLRMPSFRYTEEEITEVNTILVDLNAYVDEWFALFVNGTRDINDDATWTEYLGGFDGLRLDELMGYYNTAYERWTAAAGK